MDRRAFLRGACAAPAVVLTQGLLMPVRSWVEPVRYVGWDLGTHDASMGWGVDESGMLYPVAPPLDARMSEFFRLKEKLRDDIMRIAGWERMR